MLRDDTRARQARCIALTQEHRGHGVSTTAYYLSRVLVAQGLRVLLVDLTGRRARLHNLVSRGPVKNLVLWSPALARPEDVRPVLEQARRQTAGKADVLLLDVDAALLERAGGLSLGLDYVLVVTEHTEAGQDAADRTAQRLGDDPPPHGRVGVVFSRVDAPAMGELPEQTEHRHTPVLGHFPADYLLAGGDAYSLKGNESSWPHDAYLYALLRLGQKLIQMVPLQRATGLVGMNPHLPPRENNGHTQPTSA
jgi:hypothetical protein